MVGANAEGKRLERGLLQNEIEEACGVLGAEASEHRDGIKQW